MANVANEHHFYSLQNLQLIFQIDQFHLIRLLWHSKYFHLNLFGNNCMELIYNEKFFINLLSVDENGITVLLSHMNYAIAAITFFNWTRICNKIWIHLPWCLLTSAFHFHAREREREKIHDMDVGNFTRQLSCTNLTR